MAEEEGAEVLSGSGMARGSGKRRCVQENVRRMKGGINDMNERKRRRRTTINTIHLGR